MTSRTMMYARLCGILLASGVIGRVSTARASVTWSQVSPACVVSTAGSWVIGCDPPSGGGRSIWQFNGSSFEFRDGRAVTITLDQNLIPWVVTNDGSVWKRNGLLPSDTFSQFGGNICEFFNPVCARHDQEGIASIAVGRNDTQAWVLDCGESGYPGNFFIRRWTGSCWQIQPGAASQIAVDADGVAWVINTFNQVYRFNGSSWDLINGAAAKSISYGDRLTVIGTDNQRYRWNGTTFVGEGGQPPGVTPAQIFDTWEKDTNGNVWRALGAQQFAEGDGTHQFAEPGGMAVLGSDGAWQMMVHGNTSLPNDGWDSTHWVYSCTRDNYGSWRTISETSSPALALSADPRGFYRGPKSGSRAFLEIINDDDKGITIFDSANPCSTDAFPAWHYSRWQFANTASVDFPDLIYDESRDQGAFVFTQVCNGCSTQVLYAGHVNATNTAISYNFDSLTTYKPWYPRAAFDSSGLMHIVFYTDTDQSIRHTTFNPTDNSFSPVVDLVDYVQEPTGSCPVHVGGTAACVGISTLKNISNDCLKASPKATIAIDRVSSPNNIVVTFATRGGGSCADMYEQRMYKGRSLGNGHWAFDYMAVTGCATSVHPEVTTTHVPGVSDTTPARFHILSRYSNQGGTGQQLAVVDWTSNDGGVSWSGQYISDYMTIPGPISLATGNGKCYWGDFDQASPDPAHGRMFYAWGVPINNPLWNIMSATNAQ